MTLPRSSGLAHVAMPFGAWGGFLAELAAAGERVETGPGDASADAAAVRGALARVPVRVEAVAVSMRMKLRDVAGLSVGSVLETPRRASDDIVVAVEGRPKFRAALGTLRGRRAFRVGGPAREAVEAVEPPASPQPPEAPGTPPEVEG